MNPNPPFALLAALLILPALTVRAQQPANAPPDLVTLSGNVYKSARVGSIEPDGITYFFVGGVVKVPFDELPESVRKQNGYDPKKAEAFAAADDKTQRQTMAVNQKAYEAEQQAKLQHQISAAEDQVKEEARRKKDAVQRKAKQ